jgi:phage FluMu gp28-like protein
LTPHIGVRQKVRAGARLDAWVSSRDEIAALLFVQDARKFADVLNVAADSLGNSIIDDEGHTAYQLRFANGLRVFSLSSNPDAQAGKRGDRILDEFALHGDPRKLYEIAYPGITWGGSLEIFSSHRGSANYFNELVREICERNNPKGFSFHRITLQDALDQGFLFKLQSKLPHDAHVMP